MQSRKEAIEQTKHIVDKTSQAKVQNSPTEKQTVRAPAETQLEQKKMPGALS